MVAFESRPPLQMLRMTAALLATKVLAPAEFCVVVDGLGVPTGSVYVGDGATLGGLGPFAFGNGDLDDGYMRFVDVYDVSGAGPIPFPGGGTAQLGWMWYVVGADAAGTLIGTVAQKRVYTGDWLVAAVDNASVSHGGFWVLAANAVRSINGAIGEVVLDASDIDPVTDRNYVTDAELATLQVAGRTAQVYNSGAQSLLGSLGVMTVTLDSSLSMDTGFSLDGNEITCDFAGRVRISYHVSGNDNSGANQRSHSLFWVERQPDGGSYSTVVGTETSAYHRDSRDGGNAACVGTILTVAADDKLRLRWDVGGAGQTVQIPAEHAVLTIERI